jgi:hypothetical protein
MYGMTAHRLRAPSTDGGLLVEPAASAVGAQIAANTAKLSQWDHDFQGRRADWLRTLVRREVLTLAGKFLGRHGLVGSPFDIDAVSSSSRPLVVTGHQPELFHPGVWVKAFAAAGIAGSHQGVALNLIVDNDIPKSTSIQVPTLDQDGLRVARVEFDRWENDTPYEDLAVRDESRFSTFADRVRQALGVAVKDPVLDEFWPLVLRRGSETALPGMRFSLARREIEAEWGISNLEVPLSEVCQTDGFLWFASHILAQLPRYRQVYNDALREYRTAHGIRSKHHPVAALDRRGDWLEAPFWVWRAGRPRRRALLVRQRHRQMDLRIDGEDEVFIELPLSPDGEACCAVERLRDLPGRSIRLRTRALTTTMFSRFLLGDLFIHGIGGAKYDELGDEIARRYLGIEPPGFLALSMTTWLGLPRDGTTPEELLALERCLRDLRFNPDRYLGEPFSEEIRTLIRAKQEAITRPVGSRRERVARCRAIRACNEAMQAWVGAIRDDLVESRSRMRNRLRSNRIARNREFSFVLYSQQRLREVLSSVARANWGEDRAV